MSISELDEIIEVPNLSRRGNPMLDESVGVRSKYWTFTCQPRSEFHSDRGLTRLKLENHKGVFAYWKIGDETAEYMVTGYVEYRIPVSEAMIVNYAGANFSGQVSIKRPRIAPEGFKSQEDMEHHRYECKTCAVLCYDKSRRKFEGLGFAYPNYGYGMCVDCGGSNVKKMPKYMKVAMKAKASSADGSDSDNPAAKRLKVA